MNTRKDNAEFSLLHKFTDDVRNMMKRTESLTEELNKKPEDVSYKRLPPSNAITTASGILGKMDSPTARSAVVYRSSPREDSTTSLLRNNVEGILRRLDSRKGMSVTTTTNEETVVVRSQEFQDS